MMTRRPSDITEVLGIGLGQLKTSVLPNLNLTQSEADVFGEFMVML